MLRIHGKKRKFPLKKKKKKKKEKENTDFPVPTGFEPSLLYNH